MKISKKNLKKKVEKEIIRKQKRKEKHKEKIRKIEKHNEIKNVMKKMLIFLGNVELAKQKDIQKGNNPTTLKVPEKYFDVLQNFKAKDGKVQGLELKKWDINEDKLIINENSLDIDMDFMVL